MVLYEHTQKRDLEKKKFEAALHGIDLDKEMKKQEGGQSVEEKSGTNEINQKGFTFDTTPTESGKNEFLFLAPEDYEKMSEEEQEELGRKMFNSHKHWAEKKTTDNRGNPVKRAFGFKQ